MQSSACSENKNDLQVLGWCNCAHPPCSAARGTAIKSVATYICQKIFDIIRNIYKTEGFERAQQHQVIHVYSP